MIPICSIIIILNLGFIYAVISDFEGTILEMFVSDHYTLHHLDHMCSTRERDYLFHRLAMYNTVEILAYGHNRPEQEKIEVTVNEEKLKLDQSNNLCWWTYGYNNTSRYLNVSCTNTIEANRLILRTPNGTEKQVSCKGHNKCRVTDTLNCEESNCSGISIFCYAITNTCTLRSMSQISIYNPLALTERLLESSKPEGGDKELLNPPVTESPKAELGDKEHLNPTALTVVYCAVTALVTAVLFTFVIYVRNKYRESQKEEALPPPKIPPRDPLSPAKINAQIKLKTVEMKNQSEDKKNDKKKIRRSPGIQMKATVLSTARILETAVAQTNFKPNKVVFPYHSRMLKPRAPTPTYGSEHYDSSMRSNVYEEIE